MTLLKMVPVSLKTLTEDKVISYEMYIEFNDGISGTF